MATVTAGQSATITIPAGAAWSITTTGEARVELVAGAAGAGFTSWRVTPDRPLALPQFSMQGLVRLVGVSGTTSDAAHMPAALTPNEVTTIRGAVSGDSFLPQRTVGAESEQPAGIIKPVKRFGRLAANFASGLWTVSGGTATVTQGYTGWDGAGAKTGIQSRTGQPGMLKAVMAAAGASGNAAHEITLSSVATNMLTRQLAGKLGLWVYVERQPGYEPAGTLAGTLAIDISTASASTNGMYAGWNSNQIKEGWNFLKLVQRNPAAYVVGSGVAEYHPFGTLFTSFGTGADTDLVNGTVNRLRINWSNMADNN